MHFAADRRKSRAYDRHGNGLIQVTPTGLVLEEVAPGLTADDVQRVTEPTLILSPNIKVMEG